MAEEEERISGETGEKKVSKKRVMTVGAVIVAAIVIAIVTGFCVYNTSENRLARALDLGQKYLLEEDYEQAVVEFNKAIEIDPMSVDAYLGAAEAYVWLGDLESAKETVERGLEAVEDVRLEEKLKEIQSEIDRIAKEEEERQRAAEAAEREAEEKRKTEEALKLLYEKLEAGEEDEAIVEYVWRENLMEREGSYSPTGDTENGIVLDMQKSGEDEDKPCFFYGEKTDGCYETAGKWYYIDGDENKVGIIEYMIYEGEWKNGMPNGQGVRIWIKGNWCETYETHPNGKNMGKCVDRYVMSAVFENGYVADGVVQEIEYIDIFDWLDWWDSFKMEFRCRVKDKNIIAGSCEYNYYHDDCGESGWIKLPDDGSESGPCIPGPWITEW